MFFLAVSDLSHCPYHTWLALLLKGQTILSLPSWESSFPRPRDYTWHMLTWKWCCGSLGCHCCSPSCPGLEDAGEELSGDIQAWGITITPGLCAGGSGESGGHPCHLQWAQGSTNFVVLSQLGYLLQCMSVTGPFTCYGDMKYLMSSRRPAIKYLAEIQQVALYEHARRHVMQRKPPNNWIWVFISTNGNPNHGMEVRFTGPPSK